jgi:DNA-binding MarR family transcriptional regulator
MNLDQKLKETVILKQDNWGKVVAILKRQFDEWAIRKLSKEGYSDFKMVYMPVLMNIGAGGTNNNELAQYAKVSKQAMSKVAKELQELGYIQAKPSKEDKRNTIFTLTDRGKRLVIHARLAVKDLMDNYRGFIGEKEFDKSLKTLLKIIEYTDQLLLTKNE